MPDKSEQSPPSGGGETNIGGHLFTGDVSANAIAGRDYVGGDQAGRDIVKGDVVSRDKIVNIYASAAPQPVDDQTLAAARQTLAALPLDTIPPPAGHLPPGSRMPLPRNPLFVGREADLRQLAAALKGEPVAAVTGLGGIGKSQLAVEFAHRYGQYFAGGVFWLNFGEPASIPAEVAACGRPGRLNLAPNFDRLELETQLRLVAAAWQSALPRLLIFDNCEAEALLLRWRPPAGGCRVLLTGRRAQWSRALGVRPLPLGVLSRAESIALLRGHRPDLAPTDPALNAIAAELGDLPLALSLAGGYLETFQADPTLGDPADFLAELRDSRLLDHPALQGEDVTPSPTNHLLHVGKTFALSYEALKRDDPVDALALQLLGRAACFAPGEAIPRALLLAALGLPDDDDRAGHRQAARAFNRLLGLGLLEAGAGGALALHRLLAEFIERARPDPAAREAVEATLLAEANRLNNAGYPAPLLAWQAHLRAVTDAARQRTDERAAGLCNTLGYHLNMIGDTAAARPYYERALAIREKALGPAHPDTALSLNNLGALLDSMGDYAAARPYFERALAIYEQALGPAHPDTALSLNNLGGLLDSMGDYAAARPYYERALAIFTAKLGPDHPHTRIVRGNLDALDESVG